MKPSFEVSVIRFELLRMLEGSWLDDDFTNLLEEMEYGDTRELASEELREMCLLSLQDLEPHLAAELLLRHKLGNQLTGGEIRNMSHEMVNDKLWEEHAGMGLHEALFNIGSLLFEASPKIFPEPDAVRVKLSVTALNKNAMATLADGLTEAFIVRLLADGMDPGAALCRRFRDQLGSQSFPEADAIAWIINCQKTGEDSIETEIISSGYWLDSLRDTRKYKSQACPDETI